MAFIFCRYIKIVQIIFKYTEIEYTTFTLDKKLNSLIYGTLFCVNIYGSYKLSKAVRFLAHPVYSATGILMLCD